MDRTDAFLELEEAAKDGNTGGILISIALAAVREDTSDIIIGESTLVNIKTDSLCASYIEAEKLLKKQLDGG